MNEIKREKIIYFPIPPIYQPNSSIHIGTATCSTIHNTPIRNEIITLRFKVEVNIIIFKSNAEDIEEDVEVEDIFLKENKNNFSKFCWSWIYFFSLIICCFPISLCYKEWISGFTSYPIYIRLRIKQKYKLGKSVNYQCTHGLMFLGLGLFFFSFYFRLTLGYCLFR